MTELQEQIAPEYSNTSFVTYRGMNIFCKFVKFKQAWYVRVKYINGTKVIAACHSQEKEKALNWAMQYIDAMKSDDSKAKWDLILNPDL